MLAKQGLPIQKTARAGKQRNENRNETILPA